MRLFRLISTLADERPFGTNIGHPHGHAFASAGEDGKIRLWERILWNDYNELRDRVCALVGTGLSRAEWDRLVPDLTYHKSCP